MKLGETEPTPEFDVFLSHAHVDAHHVELLANRLENECNFKVWLDRWLLIAGTRWQQEMAKALANSRCCAVCLGANTPGGWFREEVERALNLQVSLDTYRVIPVLLPDCPMDVTEVMPGFLELRTWADFRNGRDKTYAFHVLAQGVRGLPIGRWPPETSDDVDKSGMTDLEVKLAKWRRLKEAAQFSEKVVVDYELELINDVRRILDDGD